MRVLILSITFLLFQLSGVFAIDLVGKVEDKATGEALAFATISDDSGQFGVITDENGNFRLEIESFTDKDTFIISYLGYQPLKLTADQIKENPICRLELYSFEIAEVEIIPIDIENILRKTYDSFYKNHVHKNISTKGYFREQFFEAQKCVRYGEVVFESNFYEEDGEDVSVVFPHLARSVEDSTFLKKFNSIFNSKKMLIPFGIDNYFKNGIAESFKIDQFHKFMGKFFFEKKNDGFTVDYKLNENYVLNKRENYYIQFDIEKRNTKIATGHFLIDSENYGIAAFEIELNQQEDLTRILIPARFRLIMKLLGYSAEIVNFEAKINSRYKDGKWYIGNGIQRLEGGIAKRGEWFRGKVINEFHSFESVSVTKKKTANKKFKDQRTNEFSSNFWQQHPYSPIQPQQQTYIKEIIERNASFSGEVLSEKAKKNIEKKKLKKLKKK